MLRSEGRSERDAHSRWINYVADTHCSALRHVGCVACRARGTRPLAPLLGRNQARMHSQ